MYIVLTMVCIYTVNISQSLHCMHHGLILSWWYCLALLAERSGKIQGYGLAICYSQQDLGLAYTAKWCELGVCFTGDWPSGVPQGPYLSVPQNERVTASSYMIIDVTKHCCSDHSHIVLVSHFCMLILLIPHPVLMAIFNKHLFNSMPPFYHDMKYLLGFTCKHCI